MQVFHDPASLPDTLQGAAIALGNFDGVHKGHQQVLQGAKDAASTLKVPSGVMVFEPHPRDFFAPDKSVFRLTPLAEKLSLFEAYGLDMAIVMSFNTDLAGTEAESFVQEILLDRLGISHVVSGFDFHFGKNRAGSPAFLRDAGARLGFGVTIVDPVKNGGDPFSSSAIRVALEQGDVASAGASLGYPWFVRGEVIKGEQRGRTLGFPTANLAIPTSCRLKYGIYGVRVRRNFDGRINVHDGVASFGVRPTFGGGEPLLETFLFDFDADLYGQIIEVELIDFIREERTFEGADELIEVMNQDTQHARTILAAAAQAGAVGKMEKLRNAISI